MFEFWKTFREASGPHPLRIASLIGGTAYTLTAAVETLLQTHGINYAPTVPKVIFVLIAIVGLLLFWGWKHAHLLRMAKEPRLSIGDPIGYTMPKNAVGLATRTFKLRISNDSGQNIEECRVRLQTMTNKNGDGSYEEGRHFKLTRDKPGDPHFYDFTMSFDIAPHDFDEVDICSYSEDTGHLFIEMHYATHSKNSGSVLRSIPKGLGPHILEVAAVAKNTVPVRKKFKFDVDEMGFFYMKAI